MDEYLNGGIAYLQANPVIAAAIGLVLLYLLIRKTKLFILLLVMALVLGAVFFVIMEMAGTGSASKKGMIDQINTQDVK